MSGLLLVLTIVFTLPYLAWRLARTNEFAPLFVVQIVAGILLGPAFVGEWLPDFHGAVFTAPVLQSVSGIAAWSVAIFVWLAGLELDLRAAWAHRRESVITAALALSVPLLFGMLVASALTTDTRWIGPTASDWQFVLAIGMACAVTALPILILILETLGIFRLPLGQRVLRYASLDDVAIWGILALILLDLQRVGMQSAYLAAFAASSVAYRRAMPRLSGEDRWYVALVGLVLSAWAADTAGLHFMIGAFLAGAVTDVRWFALEQVDRFRQGVLLFLMPVYFLSTGLRTEWGIGGLQVFCVAAAFLAASVSGKLLGVHVAGRLLGWTAGEASTIGWLLQTKALIMIVYVSVLLDEGIIAAETFTALLIMAIASTVLTIPIVRPKLARLAAAGERR